MKKFLIKILIFSFSLLIINLIFKKILDRIYFDEYFLVDLDKEIYLLSDSHGDVIGGFENEKIYNFSKGGDSYLDMKNKLNFLINKTNVRTIIISADDHTLSPYRETLNNADRSSFFKSSDNYKNYVDFFKHKYILNNLILLEPKYGVILNKYFQSFVISSSKTEATWSSLSEKVKEQKSIKRFKDQFDYSESSPMLEKELKEIIRISKENEIKLVGIKFPLSKHYNNVVGAKSFQADSLLFYNNVKIYNFNNKNFEDDELFKDQDHLNDNGAKFFRQLLLDSIRLK